MTRTIKTNGKTKNNGAVAKEREIGTKMNSSTSKTRNQEPGTNGNMITHSITKLTTKITKSIAIVKKQKQMNNQNQNEPNLEIATRKINKRTK